jgi:protein gp37
VHHGVCDGEAAACHRYRLAATNIMEAGWTLPNVWVGTTVENQPAADERIPHLLATPAAVRFVSCEPLLGPVDVWPKTASGALLNRGSVATGRGIDWVICGGETGPGARPMHPDWARSLRDQCVAARVPFFFKRWGEWAPDGFEHANRPNAPACYLTADGNSYMADNWTPEHRCRDEKYAMVRVGKKAAGRELDGRTWDEMPDVAGEEDR